MSKLLSRRQISAVAITRKNFQPYGQLITPTEDGKLFDETDAVLTLQNGTPRFYIMHLNYRGKVFSKITRHSLCTQCLGSSNGHEWLIAVCPPSVKNEPELNCLRAFRIRGNCFIKMEVGTWHSGPYFDRKLMDFYNLELSDTNIVDHYTYNFATQQNLEFEIIN